MKVNQKPDYITCISFPYNDSLREDEGDIASYKTLAEKEFHRSSNTLDIEQRIEGLLKILHEQNYYGGCVLTEWNYSISNRNYIQDSTYRAAFTVQCMINNLDKIDIFGIFYASDLLSAYSDTKTVLQGSSGIMTRDGIEKPVFHGFKFLNQLGKHILSKTDNCLITADDEGRAIRILVFNCQSPEANYYLLAEDTFKPTEVAHMFSNSSEEFNIKLEGLNLGSRVQVHQNILNEEYGSVLHHWIQMGCSHNLSRDDLQYLKNVSIPETVIEEIKVEDATVELDLELKTNEIRLICLTSAK
jgi:beta-xylosidase